MSEKAQKRSSVVNTESSSMIESGYKKKYDLYIFLIFLLWTFFFFFVGLSSFKVLFVLVVFSVVVVAYLTQSLFASVFLHTLYFLPIIYPGRLYYFQLFWGRDIADIAFKEGYFLEYGIRIRDLLAFFLLVLTIKQYAEMRSQFTVFFQGVFSLHFLFLFVYIVVLVISTQRFSPYPTISYTMGVQYGLFFVTSMATFLYTAIKKHIHLRHTVIAMLLLQFLFVAGQFIVQSFLGKAQEVASGGGVGTGLDENNALFRPFGTLAHPNQVALFILVLLVVYFALLKKKPVIVDGLIGVAGFLMITITQSRSVMIGLLATLLVLFFHFRKESWQWFSRHRVTALKISIVIAPVFLFIVLPRIYLTQNFFEKGAGGYIRLKQLEEAAKLAPYYWLSGAGVATNEKVFLEANPKGVMNIFPAPLHNGFLQLFFEIGFVGLMLFIAPIYLAVRVAASKLSKKFTLQKCLFIGFGLAITCYYMILLHLGVTEFPLLGVVVGLICYYLVGSNQKELRRIVK